MTDLLQLASSGKAEQFLRNLRVRALYSPYFFIKTILAYKDLAQVHHEELERFVSEWSLGQRKQAIEWPRAWFKTTTYTIGCSMWVVLPVSEEDTIYALEELGLDEAEWFRRTALHDQDATQLLAFETAPNAEKKLGVIKYHFEENSLFRACFPEIAHTGEEPKWNNKCLIIRRAGKRKADAEGTFEAIGVGGALQSRHYSIVWEDDLVGEAARKSDKVMEDTIGWHTRLAGVFEDGAFQTRFLVSNRWGYNDLNSWVRENEPDFLFHTRAAWEPDENGELVSTFPERYTIEGILSLKEQKMPDGSVKQKMSDYDFSCQYLNSPRLEGEREIDKTKLHFYNVDSNGTITCEHPDCKGKSYRASQMYRFMRYDPYNAKGAGSSSCPAIVVIGTTSDRHVFVLDCYTTKEDYSKVYDRLFFYNDTWRPREFTYEDVGHQNLTEHHIRSLERTEEHRKKHKTFARIVGCPTGGKSKEFRIREGLFPLVEKKKFGLRRVKHQNILNQLETFPFKVIGHDYDLLDALSQKASELRFPMSEDDSIFQRDNDEEAVRNFNTNYSHVA